MVFFLSENQFNLFSAFDIRIDGQKQSLDLARNYRETTNSNGSNCSSSIDRCNAAGIDE